jgi:alpha-ketoglutarate-dependent taurine dioxygenase
MSKTIGVGKKRIGALRRRAAITTSGQDLVKIGRLDGDRPIPFLIQPNIEGVNLSTWAAENREQVDQWLGEHRALLFRGFGVHTVEAFEATVMAASNGELLEYRDRSTPRTTQGNRIYTSTVHPADQRIHLHNEGTYWLKWALKIFFCCQIAPPEGGATPIANVHHVHNRIRPEIRDRFIERQWALVRNFNDGFGLSWQETYQTDDRSEVEAYCRANGVEFEWKEGDRLRTRQVRPAVRKHPVTGEALWFNHAAFFHHTSLEPTMRDALISEFGVDGLPYNTTYGDGSPIEPEVAAHLRSAYEEEKVIFPWQEGDVMLLDNMTIAHAREPYVGDRKVIVSMTDAVDGTASS